MGRNPRPFVPGGPYHLTAHGTDDRPIFVDDAAIRDRWLLHAVCLLGTHYHLVVQPSRDLSSGMRVLNGAHSRFFTRRHERRGALFESRYFERTIRDVEHLAIAVTYVHNNPVEAGLVDDPSDWSWSTYPGCALRELLSVCA